MTKLKAILSGWTGWGLVLTFLYSGLVAVQSGLTGNGSAIVGVIVSALGLYFHPTEMAGGKKIK